MKGYAFQIRFIGPGRISRQIQKVELSYLRWWYNLGYKPFAPPCALYYWSAMTQISNFLCTGLAFDQFGSASSAVSCLFIRLQWFLKVYVQICSWRVKYKFWKAWYEYCLLWSQRPLECPPRKCNYKKPNIASSFHERNLWIGVSSHWLTLIAPSRRLEMPFAILGLFMLAKHTRKRYNSNIYLRYIEGRGLDQVQDIVFSKRRVTCSRWLDGKLILCLRNGIYLRFVIEENGRNFLITDMNSHVGWGTFTSTRIHQSFKDIFAPLWNQGSSKSGESRVT